MTTLLGCESHAKEVNNAFGQHLHRSTGANANERHDNYPDEIDKSAKKHKRKYPDQT